MITALKYYRLNLKWWLEDNATPLLVVGLLLLATGGAMLVRAALPTRPAAVIVRATPALATLAPTATPVGGLPRGAIAYDEPGGRALGALDAGRAYVVLARYAGEWVQLDAGSGPVWVRGSEAGLVVDAALADLQPQPTAQVVIVAEVREQVVYVPAPAPQPLPAEPATDAAAVMNAAALEASHRAAGDTFTVSSAAAPRQAGPAQCSNDGRSCLGRKP